MSLFFAAAIAAALPSSSADIEIRSARLNYARPRDTLGYSVVVTNDGPDAALGVELLISLPPGAAARNAEPCTIAGALVRCRIGVLVPGEERRVFILVITPETHASVAAFAVSETQDPEMSNNVMNAAR